MSWIPSVKTLQEIACRAPREREGGSKLLFGNQALLDGVSSSVKNTLLAMLGNLFQTQKHIQRMDIYNIKKCSNQASTVPITFGQHMS